MFGFFNVHGSTFTSQINAKPTPEPEVLFFCSKLQTYVPHLPDKDLYPRKHSVQRPQHNLQLHKTTQDSPRVGRDSCVLLTMSGARPGCTEGSAAEGCRREVSKRTLCSGAACKGSCPGAEIHSLAEMC